MTLKESHEKCVALHAKCQELRSSWNTDSPSTAQMADFDKIYADWKKADATRNDLFRASELQKWDPLGEARDSDLAPLKTGRRPTIESREEKRYHFNRGLRAWLDTQCGTDAQAADIESAGLSSIQVKRAELEIPMQISRDLDVSTAEKGLETIPEGFLRRIYLAELEVSNVRNFCTVINSSREGALPIPVVDDTANSGTLDLEGGAMAYVDPEFDQVVLGSFKYKAGVKMSRELTEDSAFDITSWLADRLGTRIGRVVNQELTNGDGSGNPNGYEVATDANANADVPTTGTAVTYALLLSTYHLLDPAYRRNAVWSFHDTTLELIRAVEDTAGGLIWQESMRVGEPSLLFGKPYFINQDLDDVAGTWSIGENALFFGDMSRYIARKTGSTYLTVLRELFAGTDEVAVVMRERWDGDLASQADWNPSPIVHLTKSA